MAAPAAAAAAKFALLNRRELLQFAGNAAMSAAVVTLGLGTLIAGAAARSSTAAPGGGGGTVGGGAMGPVGADVLSAAIELKKAKDAGNLTFLSTPGNYAFQIDQLAAGDGSCGLALPCLQLIQIALAQFGTVGISDLNRACTGDLPHSSGYSAHWVGRAVDFASLGGQILTGGDSASVALLQRIAPLLPPSSQVGQVEDRYAHGSWFDLGPNVSEFTGDAPNHLHVDVGRNSSAGLLL